MRAGPVLVALVVVLAGVPTHGVASSQTDLSVSVSAPESVQVNQTASVNSSISVPDFVGDNSGQLTVSLSVDGQEVASRTITVQDGITTTVNFTHTFESTGTHTVEVSGSISIAGQSLSDSVSTGVDVTSPSVLSPSNLSFTIDAPSETNVSENVSINTTALAPDLTDSYTASLTVELLVDGTVVASRSVSIQDGTTRQLSFEHAFESSGSHTVTVRGSVTFADLTFTNSTSTTVSVAVPTSTVQGAAFPVPPSLEDEIQNYRNTITRDLAPHAFVLATETDLYVVFTTEQPTEGMATVEGFIVNQTFTDANLTFGGIAATTTSFTTVGNQTTVSAVADNPATYRLELVRINATHRHVATLTDPDQGAGFTASTTAGILVADPLTAVEVLENVGQRARQLAQNNSTATTDEILAVPQEDRLFTTSFETDFWADDEATVDAIVLSPQTAARQFVAEFEHANISHVDTDDPLLYRTNQTWSPSEVDNVSELDARIQTLDGEVVAVNARLYAGRVSVQETIEHATGCEEDLLEIQTPQGPVCVNVPQDVLIHAGAAWNTVPQSRGDVLFVVGASSLHQDQPIDNVTGRYRLVGELVSTARINASLPDGMVLLIYEQDRLGSINYDEVTQEARTIIENQTSRLVEPLRTQVLGNETESNDSSEPGGINVSGFAPGDTTITASGSVNATVAIQNGGSQTISGTIELRVAGTVVASRPVTLAGGESRTISFVNVDPGSLSPGNYTYGIYSGVDNQTATLTVEQPDQGTGSSPYTNARGIVDTNGLQTALGDWASGDLSTTRLIQILGAWSSGTGLN